MIISWINKFTTIDFPWELACVVFTPWCNLRCSYCHNSDFVIPEKIKNIRHTFIPKNAIFNFLEKRKQVLTGVSVCWGEPTLQLWLYDFCKRVKEMWFKVKVDTNGLSPQVIEKLIKDDLVDYVAMDVKQEIWKLEKVIWIKFDEKKYLQTIDLLKNSKIDYEFRTTVIKWVHNEKDMGKIAKQISFTKNYYLQNFKNFSWTLDENFSWESFSTKELETLQKLVKKYIKNTKIRN